MQKHLPRRCEPSAGFPPQPAGGTVGAARSSAEPKAPPPPRRAGRTMPAARSWGEGGGWLHCQCKRTSQAETTAPQDAPHCEQAGVWGGKQCRSKSRSPAAASRLHDACCSQQAGGWVRGSSADANATPPPISERGRMPAAATECAGEGKRVGVASWSEARGHPERLTKAAKQERNASRLVGRDLARVMRQRDRILLCASSIIPTSQPGIISRRCSAL